ncbi:hypothetical protein M1B72_05400 [Geomonas paludis]|uniref:Lipoprotein n=1 Tax=Geomonas paludis TaxID=2740185 RepID=A0A6V8MX14_9BACT|nr:hypothetical protein [Geomonas paludis]UPU37146.1 hypothetical protein M1B72_05400 [Geomonas paludis]GFO64756.1 hypothetical protein GMPD_26750 [Geomonas paludis]
MSKKHYLLAAFLVMSATPSLAQQWQQLGTYDESTYYFINPKTFSIGKDGTVSTWTKREFNVDVAKTVKESIPPEKIKGKKTHVYYEEYDCAGQKKRILTGMTYDNEAATMKDQEKTGWLPIPVGLEKNIFDGVCRKANAGK